MSTPATRKARVEVLYTLWAKNEKCGPMKWSARAVDGWLPLFTGMAQQAAIDEMIERQDRVRRTGWECRFKVAPDGKRPDER